MLLCVEFSVSASVLLELGRFVTAVIGRGTPCVVVKFKTGLVSVTKLKRDGEALEEVVAGKGR